MVRLDRLLRKKQALDLAKNHIVIVGEIVAATNQLQNYFFNLFHIALSYEREGQSISYDRFHNHALEMWHVIQADKSQRDLAYKAISTVPSSMNMKPALHRLKWAMQNVDVLSEARNIVAHVPISMHMKMTKGVLKWEASFSGSGVRPAQKAKVDLIPNLKFWAMVRNDILNLSTYVGTVVDKIYLMEVERKGASNHSSRTVAWPNRPKLPSVLRLQEIKKHLQVQTAKHKPKRPLRRKSVRP